MKYLNTQIIILISCMHLCAQTKYFNFFIRNFQQNLCITLNDLQSKYQYSDYGNLIKANDFNDLTNRYLFQSQEHSKDLGIHFFPYRNYDSTNKRFFSPDPKSQYFSPYLFVDSDPINIIDRDGKEGKPLILHAEDYTTALQNHSTEVAALKAQFPDAHTYPLSHILNKEPIDLTGWNGRIFIHTPIQKVRDVGEFVVERSDLGDEALFKYKLGRVTPESSSLRSTSSINPETLGQRIRELGETRQIESVALNSTESDLLVNRFKKGFFSKIKPSKGRKMGSFKLLSLKRNHTSLVLRESSQASGKFTRMHFPTRDYCMYADAKTHLKMVNISREYKGQAPIPESAAMQSSLGRLPESISGDYLSNYVNAENDALLPLAVQSLHVPY